MGIKSFKGILPSALMMASIMALTITILSPSPVHSALTPHAQVDDNWSAHTPLEVYGNATGAPTGLSPTQIRAVYNLPENRGSGTIAIVDAYDDPTAENDLNVFSSQFGLPPITSVNFEKHMMAPDIKTDGGWALEISLDVQWAHAIAPYAKILLVEASSDNDNDLLDAVDYARNRSDVVAVSMSWGGSEFSTESSYDSHFVSPYGATFFASSGDSGAGVNWPAASPNVVAVGGTTLTFNPDWSLASENAWSDSGGGVSAYESEPSYQLSYGLSYGKRAVPDVSYDADPSSGVSVYDSTRYQGQTGWFTLGGTSAGSPQWAAIQSIGLSASNNNFYKDAKSVNYPSYFRDITSGSNGYPATTGYDLVTGLGSPITTNYVPVNVSISPSSQSGMNGATLNYTVTVNNNENFPDTYNLTATDNAGWSENVSPTPIVVAALSSDNATLSVTIPDNAVVGTIDNITVTATLQTDNTVSGSSSCTANVLNPFKVGVSISPGENQAENGQTVTFTVKVNNTGNASDNYNLTASDNDNWGPTLDDNRFENVPPSENRTTTLRVHIPDNAVLGTFDNITVTVVSQGNPSVENSAGCVALSANILPLNLVAGWNLVGFPIVTSSTTPASVFLGLTYPDNYIVYWWNAPTGPYQIQGPTTPFNDNTGYLVYLNTNITVSIFGTKPANCNIFLVAGWNLVCFPIVSSSTTPANVFTGLTYPDNYVVYWWNAPTGPYTIQGPASPFYDNLGYWVYLNTPMTVTVP
jgi:subtilase family serine protease